jgi:hypothetical protein
MSASKKNGQMSYVDAGGELRRYTGVALIFCGLASLMMFTGLAVKIGEPDFTMTPVLIAAPFIVVGIVVTAVGIITRAPRRSAGRSRGRVDHSRRPTDLRDALNPAG